MSSNTSEGSVSTTSPTTPTPAQAGNETANLYTDKVTELFRESARYVLANDDGFYTRREIWEARRLLAETEPLPDAWAGKLPSVATQEQL